MGCVLFSVIFVNGLFPFLDQKKPEDIVFVSTFVDFYNNTP